MKILNKKTIKCFQNGPNFVGKTVENGYFGFAKVISGSFGAPAYFPKIEDTSRFSASITAFCLISDKNQQKTAEIDRGP